ncbi:response regulator [Pedobacter sp. SYSU D00535]|uniref:response regulator n=1 Tax=Pedobacter sp. SYSU D00535 TaxID=2810308 RepID=UPI001A96B083|nr:response regulator [Pedobacter sp. SYSU D00535]
MLDAIIIDDDPLHHKITEIYIRKRSAFKSFKSYTNPVNALVDLMDDYYASKELPDVILLDLNMPELNGWSFLDVFNNIIALKGCKTSVYIVTSSIDPNDKERAKLYSCVKGFYPKPVSYGMFDDILQEGH